MLDVDVVEPSVLGGDNLYFANQYFGGGLCQDIDFMNHFIPSSGAAKCYGIIGGIYYPNPKELGYERVPDVAILKISDTEEKSLLNLTSATSIADSIVQGQAYDAYGWSASSNDPATNGYLRTAKSKMVIPSTEDRPYFVVDPNITYPGDSGSPLLSTGTGGSYSILGIVSLEEGYYLDLTQPKIKQWVQQALDGQIMPSCQAGERCNDYSQVTGSYVDTCPVKTSSADDFILSGECFKADGKTLVPASLDYFDQCYTGIHAKGYKGN